LPASSEAETSSYFRGLQHAPLSILMSILQLPRLSSTATINNYPLLKKYEILPVFSLYILECAKFVKKYPEKFELLKNSESQFYKTRNT
jgi:hypothetical protein